MPARKKSETKLDQSGLTFEDALGKLEGIVESMESEQLPLEDLVSQYEAGSALLKHCDSVLSAARERITLITLSNNDGKAPENLPSHTASGQNAEDPDDDNDISLF